MSDEFVSYKLHPLRDLAFATKQEWLGGSQPPDARAAFDLHPELLSVQTIFLDLAYEAFCLLRQRGETVDPEEYCARFPRYRSALRDLLVSHRYLSDNPDLLEGKLDFWP